MENKNGGLYVIITLLVVAVLGMGGYLVWNSISNKESKTNEATNNQLNNDTQGSQNVENVTNNESAIQENNSQSVKTRLYKSSDNHYVLLLAEYNHSFRNPKAGTIARDFYLKIDSIQAIGYIVGNYSILGNELNLVGKDAYNVGAVELHNVQQESNDGMVHYKFEYSNETIKFSGVELNLVK